MVRFGADCVEKTRGVVLMGNLRQQKPGRYWKIGIQLVTGTGTPLGAYAGWENYTSRQPLVAVSWDDGVSREMG